ncbi:dipeptidyl peptidase 3-like [Argiope bruennichi]|uniref:dipeptidyl peptidase 3-like n=1 Tax=Argiope bruennichi TaxID=94029 RepID=UPI002493FFD3|nr:dipeptidyl peptidase 3-like [Argiope bruennichi]XP_055953138.1 dipeptidyl peptidase 3-like [Argiope bruennichi]
MSDYIYPNNTPIVLLNCGDAFKDLTEKEKCYAHYLSKACWYGGLIVLLQTSVESPLIYTLLHKLFRLQSVSELKEIALNDCEFTEDEFTAFLIYASGIFSNMGNYKGMGDSKFIPNLPEEKFKKLLLASKFAKEDPTHLDRLLSSCLESIYSLKDSLCRLGFPSNGITTYFSKNISKEDDEIVKNFMKEKGIEAWNTRLFKVTDEIGKSCYEIRLASVLQTGDEEDRDILCEDNMNGHKFIITRGDYSKLLAIVNHYLAIAKEYAANENEIKMIENYIHSFKTGSLDAHKNGSRYWIKDKGPAIESYIGFIENYRDPAGMRAEFEGFVAMVNRKMSAKFTDLVNSAESFLPLLPWPSAYEKNKFLRPDFTSLDVLSFASSGVPAGICIPNYNEIKEKDGFKNVSLGNVLSVKPTEPPNYLSKADQDIILQYVNLAFEVNVGLHELLGHGSGKLFKKEKDGSLNFDASNVLNFETNKQVSSWYDDGETYDSVFGSTGSSYEECRAECVALYLADVPEILKIFGYEGEEAEVIVYTLWLAMLLSGIEGLQMYNPKTESWLQAHSQARYVILQVLLECGEDFVKVEKVDGTDGNPNLLLTMDRSKIASIGKPAIGKFLGKLQLYRSTADITSAKEMYDKYSAVKSGTKYPFLDYREIVMARKKPRKLFVQTNTFEEDGKINLKNYEPSAEGMIQSWVERFQEENVDDILEELWAKDKNHFS